MDDEHHVGRHRCRAGVFLQITGEISEDVDVPGEQYSPGRLPFAQALGDLGALRKPGRPVIRLHPRDGAAGVAQLVSAGGST